MSHPSRSPHPRRVQPFLRPGWALLGLFALALPTAAHADALDPTSAPGSPLADDPCAAEKAAVEAARESFQAATKTVLELEDELSVKEELIRAQEALYNRLRNEELKLKNEWQAAIDRYMACVKRPLHPACKAEKEAMDQATARLNAKAGERRKVERELKASRREVEELKAALEKAREEWAKALKALQDAQAKASGCRRRA